MKVSVVMPVYNGGKYLRAAIDSILNQSYTEFEFIIINDCSKDSTEGIIFSYDDSRIVYLKNEKNLGVARSLNRGLDSAKGQYIARLDADDIARPERLKIQVEYMDNHPEVDVLATSSQSFDEKGVLFEGHTSTDEDILKIDFLFSCGICHPTVMMRKSILEDKCLRYDNAFNKVEDYELWTRMLSMGCVIRSIDIILLDHRLHQNQVTSVYSEEMIQKLKKLHKRTLNELNISYTDNEFENFCNFCLSEASSDKTNYQMLCGLLEKILNSNKYNRKKMQRYCKGFAVRVLKDKDMSKQEKLNFCRSSSFLSFLDTIRYSFCK